MKSLILIILIMSVGVGGSAFNGDSVGDELIMHAGILLSLASCIAMFHKAGGHVLRHILVHCGAIVVFVLIGMTNFPFRATFSLSESALHRLAMNIKATDPVILPRRAGLFTIQEVGKKDDGSIYLWTNPNPDGSSGFVYRYTGEGYNLWSKLKLGDDWYFICED